MKSRSDSGSDRLRTGYQSVTLERKRLNGACIYADAAINAGVLVDFAYVIDRERVVGAFAHASSARNAFTRINLNCHSFSSLIQ